MLQAQILEMQQKMMYMQKQLEEKAEKSTNKTLKDVDIFSLPCNSSAGACKSPVKTNPFAEGVDRTVQFPTAKTFHETPKYGPALSKKITRSLDKDEKAQLFQSLSKKDKDKKEKEGLGSIEIAARDLECSSDDTDVDEEGNRNTVGSNYSEYGREIHNQIKRQAHQPINSNLDTNKLKKESSVGNPHSTQVLSRAKTIPSQGFDTLKGSTMNLSRNSANVRLPSNLITEKHSRIRISNPLINQTALDLALVGRKMIPLHKIKTAITMRETEGDWATIGVIFHKTSATSKNGNTYTRWNMTDLVGDIQIISVMLFGKAQAKYYSMPQNRVVGLLNAKVLDDRSGKGDISLSIDHPDKILEMGESVDIGKCAAKKADGTGCTKLVNINACDYCEFHVKKAYKAISSKRGDIQSSFSGTDSRSRIMQKVAPKCDVFAGGQLLNGRVVNGKVSAKQKMQDNNTLAKLGVSLQQKSLPLNRRANPIHDMLFFEKDEKAKERVSKMDHSEKQALRKVTSMSEDLGKRLLAPTPGTKALMRHLVNVEKEKDDSAKNTKDVKGLQLMSRDEELANKKLRMAENQKGAQQLLLQQKHKIKEEKMAKTSNQAIPRLGRGLSSGDILDLNAATKKKPVISIDKARALLALKGKTISKADPNYVAKRKRSEESNEVSKKRVSSSLEQSSNVENISVGQDQTNMPSESQHNDKSTVTKVVRSFTGEIIDQKRMEELKNKKSIRSHLADEAESQEEESYFNRLQKKEAMEDKVISVIDNEVISLGLFKYSSLLVDQVNNILIF